MALDLGGLLTNLGTTYIQNRYGAKQQGVEFSLPSWGDISPFTTAPPPVDVPSGYTTAGCPPGHMKKKTRKRRRRLATKSDLHDLAALKGVLGGGEAFKVWLATHGH